MGKIERALIAVSDKRGIVELAGVLERFGIEILSTGGTARVLREGGIRVRAVEEVTGVPEMFGGRVKTLHPRIHGGILARRDREEDLEALRRHGILSIDLVIIDLYPFERAAAAGVGREEIIEEIDIGGPALIRAAAKNHAHVTVVTSPDAYPGLIADLERGGGTVAPERRSEYAAEAFRRTAAYDAAISNWLGRTLEGEFPSAWTEQWRRVAELRYGENPHQRGAWYARADGGDFSLAAAEVSGDKALSYNNLLDAAAAIECAAALARSAAVIVKHCLPCGAAERDDLEAAFAAALAGDPLSAFGGILALNGTLTRTLARRIAAPDRFFEVIHAPACEPGAREELRERARWGKNCRILIGGASLRAASPAPPRHFELRSLPGAVLVQERDSSQRGRDRWTVVSGREPSAAEWEDLEFAWRVIPWVKSNGILLAKERMVVGVGAGQPSRVDAVALACRKAADRATGAALASDAFFPFADGVEEAARAGVRAAIQPGGSLRDAEVIDAADRAGMALVVTGERHFRH